MSATAPSPAPPPRAHVLLDAWEGALPGGWEIGQRLDAGAFTAVVAHRGKDPREETGAIATEEGIVPDIAWSRVVSATRDIDGDGRLDLLLIRERKPGSTPGDALERIEPVVVADRPGGPVVLPIKGIVPAHWTRIDFALGEGAAIELETGGVEAGKLVLAWNGEALAARESAVVYVQCLPRENTVYSECTVIGSAQGKEVASSFETIGLSSEVRGNLLDLAGDGPRFYLVRVGRYNGAGAAVNPLFGMVLEKSGWATMDVPEIDTDTLEDRDGDGVPELEMDVPGVAIWTCPERIDGACPVSETTSRALMMWDGARFSLQTSKLRGAYLRWVDERRSALPAVKNDCPIHRLNFVQEVYLAGRWAGASESAALAAADEVMKGTSLAACAMAGARARTWAQIRRDIPASVRDHLPEAPGSKLQAKGPASPPAADPARDASR